MSEFQLNIFSGEIDNVEEGYHALSKLDFRKARDAFQGVLAHLPDHPAATRAIEMTSHWEKITKAAESFDKDDEVKFLWQNIKEYNFENQDGPQSFHKALVESLATEVNDLLYFIPPNLCLGYLYIQSGDYNKAEDALNELLNNHPSIWKASRLSR